MENLTVRQLLKACKENDYIIVRYPSGNSHAINCKVGELAFKLGDYDMEKQTRFISYSPCNFMEYISRKIHY